MNPTIPPPQKRRWRVGWWIAAGFLLGTVIGGAGAWSDFWHRLRWAWNGGGGETANWDEPLFYLVIMGGPAGLLGAAIAAAIALTLRRIGSRKQ